MATVFNPARTMNDLHHDVKAMVIDFLPNKERYTFVDLFPEIVNQTTVFDSRIKLKGGVIGKVNLFHKLRNVKTVILPDPWIGGPIPVFLKMTKAIFNGSNPNITSFLDSTGSLLMKSSDTRPKDNFMIEQMIDYISKVRKQNPDYDGSAVRNLFTGVKAYELVRKNPGIKIKLFADYEFVKNSNGNLVDEQIRNMIVGLRMRVIPPASRFLKQVPNMTRLRLDLGRFDLDPTTNFISSLDNLEFLELEFMNMSDNSKSLVEFMLNPPRNPNLKCFNVRSLNGDFSWILPSLQLDIRPGLTRLVFIGGEGKFMMVNRRMIVDNLKPRLIDIFHRISHVRYIDIKTSEPEEDEQYKRQVLADLELIRSNLPRHRAVTLKIVQIIGRNIVFSEQQY